MRILNKNTIVCGTEIPDSKGHPAPHIPGQCLKGVLSHTCGKAVSYAGGSSKVKAEGKKVAHLSVMTKHNGSPPNVPVGMQVSPSQNKVSVMP